MTHRDVSALESDPPQRVNVLGVGVSAITIADALTLIDRWIATGSNRYVCVTGVHGVMFWGAFSLFGVLLAASRTRSAYVALVVFLAIGVIFGGRLRVRALILPIAALAVGVFLLDVTSSTTNYLVRDTASIESMSDRIPLWEYLTSAVMRESPITGLGYFAASRVLATEYNPGLGNAHSVFFEVLVGGGILGAALYLMTRWSI